MSTDPVLDHVMALGREVALELAIAEGTAAPFASSHEGMAYVFDQTDSLWDEVKAWKPGAERAPMRRQAMQLAVTALRVVSELCDDETGP